MAAASTQQECATRRSELERELAEMRDRYEKLHAECCRFVQILSRVDPTVLAPHEKYTSTYEHDMYAHSPHSPLDAHAHTSGDPRAHTSGDARAHTIPSAHTHTHNTDTRAQTQQEKMENAGRRSCTGDVRAMPARSTIPSGPFGFAFGALDVEQMRRVALSTNSLPDNTASLNRAHPVALSRNVTSL